MSSPALKLVIESARSSARTLVEETFSQANTPEERLIALKVIVTIASEIMDAAEPIQAAVEEELHINISGEVH